LRLGFFFAVLALLRKSAADGAPLDPGLRIFSPEPALILLRFACMFAYNPRFAITSSFWSEAS
jgi:hypothetical protein